MIRSLMAWLSRARTLRPDELLVRLWLVLLGATVAAGAVCSLWWPYGWDQGCFAYVANTMLHGGLPYRDAWDFKGPLTYYVFEALQYIFGRQMWAIRALDLALLTAAGFSIRGIVTRFAGRSAALATALMMALVFASFGNWYTGQPDGWAALLLVVVAALLLQLPQVSQRNVALAAFVVGACSLFKPLYAVYLALILCAAWPMERGRKPALRYVLVALACFALPIVLVVLRLALSGALTDMVDVHIRFNFERLATDPHLRMPWWRVLQVSAGILTSAPILACSLPVAAFGAAVVLRERRRAGIFILLWVFLSVGLIAAQKKFLIQNYSWHPLYPPLTLLAGIGLARLWNTTASERNSARWLVCVTVALLFKLAAREPLTQVSRWLHFAMGHATLAQYRGTFDSNAPALNGGAATDVGFSVSRDVDLAEFFVAYTRPDDEVLIWSDPLPNYLSDRPAVTPVTIAHALTTWGSPERRLRYRSELLTKMCGTHAAYFGAPAKDLRSGEDETNIVAHFPELLELLARHYDPVGRIGDVQLFKHRRGD